MPSISIFGITGTDAMEAYLTGGVDPSAASGTRIPAATTASTITYLHLPPEPPVTQGEHNHHENSHRELARQQEYLGQDWEEIRKKRRPCSGGTSSLRLLVGSGSRRTTSASGRLPSRNQQCRKGITTTAPTLQLERRNIYPGIYLPSRLGEENNLPSRPVEENISFRPVPPKEKVFTVPSRPAE